MKAINTEQLRNEINKTNASLFRVSFVEVDELSDTERGTGGFGSTNK